MILTPQTTVYLFMMVIYIIIIYIYDRARKKYKGGTIETLIKLILINTILLLAADYVYLLEFLSRETIDILQTVFRLAAMCAIAFGGLRLVST